jgi:hypothetical protein
MNPIAAIVSQLQIRDALTGALANDPVMPAPTRGRRRRPKTHAAQHKAVDARATRRAAGDRPVTSRA